jgi:hypothetical protein
MLYALVCTYISVGIQCPALGGHGAGLFAAYFCTSSAIFLSERAVYSIFAALASLHSEV